MLQVSNVSKSFGDNLLFERVSFTVNRSERVGLVGPNGCGKTTLLKIILGEIAPDVGSAWLSPGDVRIGYLAQALVYEPGQTGSEVITAALDGFNSAEPRLEQLSAQMATARGADLQKLMAEYDLVLDAFERLGGYAIGSRVDSILDGLDLGSLDQELPVELLSGGQKTRLGLARLLVSHPDLLLLDEPTNHLDIDALEWLEVFLQGFGGAIVIVSHDRTFLDRTVSSVLDMDPLTRSVTEYPGGYSDYVKAREREQSKQWSAYKDQQEYIARLQSNLADRKNYAQSIELGTIDFGPRKIAKGIARKAVVQQRRIQRLLDSEERIDRPGRTWQMKLDFVDTPASGQDVVHLEGLTMGFDQRELFRDVNLTLRAGERIALVGPNGSGKTTLARLIHGELSPLAGRVRLGAGVRLGYFAQEQEDLDPESTPFEAIRAVAPLDQTEVRAFLHYFLFSGDEVFLSIGSLSFGERARLSLARLVARGCNFLLLDEPINHLDIPSRSRFEQAMASYTGTALAIVHDRYFIQRFATGIWCITESAIRSFIDLEDMRRARPQAREQLGGGETLVG